MSVLVVADNLDPNIMINGKLGDSFMGIIGETIIDLPMTTDW